MSLKIDWVIHCVANGACDECNNIETGFLPYACNAHTHGMMRYGHMDFQLVLRIKDEEIARILNTLGCGYSQEKYFMPVTMFLEFTRIVISDWMNSRKPVVECLGLLFRMETISSRRTSIVCRSIACRCCKQKICSLQV